MAATEVVDYIARLEESYALMRERLAELETSYEFNGWERLGAGGIDDFSRTFLDKLIETCRIYFVKNPLIKRAVKLRTLYVFGQGVSITGHGPLAAIIEEFLADPQNARVYSGHMARMRNDWTLQLQGNVLFRLFTDTAGKVHVRSLPFRQVRQKITNPDDEAEVWFYRREYSQGTKSRTILYPDIDYSPEKKLTRYDGVEVDWKTPVVHVDVDRLEGMTWGVPEVYAAIDWARAYREFLESWAKLVASISRWAWKMATPGGEAAVQALKDKIATTLDIGEEETNPAPETGSIAILDESLSLEPMKHSGAIIKADDGRRLLLMVAAATGLPETFFGDAEVGTLATAKSLDRPTELGFVERQTLWAGVDTRILGYVIEQAISHQRVVPDANEPFNTQVDVDWPPILQRDPAEMVGAIVKAATLDGKAPTLLHDGRMLARLLLTALGEDDVAELVDQLFPEEEGEPIPPTPTVPDEIASKSAESLRELADRLDHRHV